MRCALYRDGQKEEIEECVDRKSELGIFVFNCTGASGNYAGLVVGRLRCVLGTGIEPGPPDAKHALQVVVALKNFLLNPFPSPRAS